MNKLLIVTSNITGHGHKSITMSLEEEIQKRNNIEYKTIEGFELFGKKGIFFAKKYVPITTKSNKLWGIIYNFFETNSSLAVKFLAFFMKKRLKKIINNYNPDLIITNHAAFNKTINLNLKKLKLNIPVVVIYADLVTISKMWINSEAKLSIVPTEKAKQIAIKNGIFEENIRVIKLPVRKKFIEIASKKELTTNRKNINFLIINGIEGSFDEKNIIESLLKFENSKIYIVTGTNEKMKKYLENKYNDYNNRIIIYGYVNNIEKLMINSDIAVVRGSPNVLMECITCLLPIVITGTLAGQEEGNIEMILQNKLGILSNNNLHEDIKELLKNNRKKLHQIRKNQLKFRDLESSIKIIEEVIKIICR